MSEKSSSSPTMIKPIHILVLTCISSYNPFSVLAEADFDLESLKNQACPAYKCSKGTVPMTKMDLTFTSIGCSTPGQGPGIYMKSSDKNEPINKCCDIKNACQQVCGTTKLYCHSLFKQCAEQICERMPNEELKEECTRENAIQIIMSEFSDCQYFVQGQRENCECIPKEMEEEQRRSILLTFYERYVNGWEQDKVENLLNKVDNSKKFAALLAKIIMKYPKSVKVVKDKNMKWMEDMMKEMGFEADKIGKKPSPGGGGEAMDLDEL